MFTAAFRTRRIGGGARSATCGDGPESDVFDESFGHFVRLLEAIAGTEGPVALKVEEILAAAFDAYQTDPESIRVLIFEVLRSPVFARPNNAGFSGRRSDSSPACCGGESSAAS